MPPLTLVARSRSLAGIRCPEAEPYPPGVKLTSQGRPPTHVYLIQRGMVKLTYTSPEGRETVVDFRFSGELVGAQAVALGQPCFGTATTVTKSKEDLSRYTPEYRDKLTDQARQLLKEQALGTLAAQGDDAAVMRRELKLLGDDGGLGSEFTGAPYAFRTSVSGTPTMITAFLLFRGGTGAPETKAIIQAFRKTGPAWELVAETGDDLDHHGLFLQELKSPRPWEMWLLAHGVMTGSNILSTRFRVYAFDGEKFTTVWSPPDRAYGEVTVKGDQLAIRYTDYEHDKETRTDRYVLSGSGVEQVSSALEP